MALKLSLRSWTGGMMCSGIPQVAWSEVDHPIIVCSSCFDYFFIHSWLHSIMEPGVCGRQTGDLVLVLLVGFCPLTLATIHAFFELPRFLPFLPFLQEHLCVCVPVLCCGPKDRAVTTRYVVTTYRRQSCSKTFCSFFFFVDAHDVCLITWHVYDTSSCFQSVAHSIDFYGWFVMFRAMQNFQPCVWTTHAHIFCLSR